MHAFSQTRPTAILMHPSQSLRFMPDPKRTLQVAVASVPARNSISFQRRLDRWFTQLVLALFCLSLSNGAVAETHTFQERPNVLLVLADDLGYSDLGCYGGEIATPHLDALAAGGLRYAQFYNTARCWPTRAALLTGYYAQQVHRDALPDSRHGGHGKRPAWAQLLPELLRGAGYRSYHAGKWHVDGTPLQAGFDRAYTLEDHNRYFSPKHHTKDGVNLPAVERSDDYYATTAIADFAIECLLAHHRDHTDQPFFQFVAFNAPHFPLHALPEDIARYAESYRAGWNVVRQERWRRLQKHQVIPGQLSALEPEVGPPYHFPQALQELGSREVTREVDWSTLTEEQQAFQESKMAIHAAMVDRLDQEFGRILHCLRDLGEFENTLVLFLSDNGASAEIMIRGDGHDPTAAPGSAASYLCLGPGWSTVANTPFRKHKTWVHEGGIATPLIIHWPAEIAQRGQWRSAVGHVIDIAPTILEVAGAQFPRYAESQAVPARPGVSLSGTFDADRSVQRDHLWWLHEGNRAVRVGQWKLVAARDQPWELYDLAIDRAETNDLAGRHPDKVGRLARQWQETADQIQRMLAQQDASQARKPERSEQRLLP